MGYCFHELEFLFDFSKFLHISYTTVVFWELLCVVNRSWPINSLLPPFFRAFYSTAENLGTFITCRGRDEIVFTLLLYCVPFLYCFDLFRVAMFCFVFLSIVFATISLLAYHDFTSYVKFRYIINGIVYSMCVPSCVFFFSNSPPVVLSDAMVHCWSTICITYFRGHVFPRAAV